MWHVYLQYLQGILSGDPDMMKQKLSNLSHKLTMLKINEKTLSQRFSVLALREETLNKV